MADLFADRLPSPREDEPRADAPLADRLRPRALDDVVGQEHLTGQRNWDYRLWGVLMLESWLAEHHPV